MCHVRREANAEVVEMRGRFAALLAAHLALEQVTIESSFSIALICTKSRRNLASASTNTGPNRSDLVLL